jgi:hypothetical protein
MACCPPEFHQLEQRRLAAARVSMNPHDEADMAVCFRDHIRDPRRKRGTTEAIFTRSEMGVS